MTAASVPPDPGLARERTVLAWQRSALALAGGAVVVGRLTFGTVGLVALVVVGFGLVHMVVIFATARRHYRIRSGVSTERAWPTGVHATLLGLQIVALGTLELLSVLRS